MSNNGTGCRMRDLTSNVQLRNSLLDDRTWWCQRVDHEFEFGNHLDYIPITSTYQVKLSVTDVQNHSACPGILNSLAVGDLVAVELPITTRRADEMISLQVRGSENCTAFMVQPPTNPSSESSNKDSKITYVDAIVPVGQICSITLLEKRIWKRKWAAFGTESLTQQMPANEALLTSASVISVSNGIAIHRSEADNFQPDIIKRSIGSAIIEHSFDPNHYEPLEFTVVLLARQLRLLMLLGALTSISFLVVSVIALIKGVSLYLEFGAISAIPLASFGLWKALWKEYFINSLFRIGKL